MKDYSKSFLNQTIGLPESAPPVTNSTEFQPLCFVTGQEKLYIYSVSQFALLSVVWFFFVLRFALLFFNHLKKIITKMNLAFALTSDNHFINYDIIIMIENC